jgi:hypothetical protein
LWIVGVFHGEETKKFHLGHKVIVVILLSWSDIQTHSFFTTNLIMFPTKPLEEIDNQQGSNVVVQGLTHDA